MPLPGVDGDLPVVGFEVESSWRTRKHVKGDVLNLLALQPALGVIVLLGEGTKIEGLRRSAQEMAGRWWGRIAVWDERDVEALAVRTRPSKRRQATVSLDPTPAGASAHTGKYRALWAWLAGQSKDRIEMTFSKIEDVLGFPLPASCRDHPAHWHSYEGSAVARAILDAGWRARRVNLANETLVLERV